MTELYKQFKIEKPETVGETDKEFDQSNYIDWLENKVLNQGQTLPIYSVSKRLDSEIEKRKKITDTIGCETHKKLTEVMQEIEHLRAVNRILKD